MYALDCIYSGFKSYGQWGAAFFPIITAGKYDDNYQMPVNITIAHAVADGYHIGLFFEYLQEEMSVECLKSHLE